MNNFEFIPITEKEIDHCFDDLLLLVVGGIAGHIESLRKKSKEEIEALNLFFKAALKGKHVSFDLSLKRDQDFINVGQHAEFFWTLLFHFAAKARGEKCHLKNRSLCGFEADAETIAEMIIFKKDIDEGTILQGLFNCFARHIINQRTKFED